MYRTIKSEIIFFEVMKIEIDEKIKAIETSTFVLIEWIFIYIKKHTELLSVAFFHPKQKQRKTAGQKNSGTGTVFFKYAGPVPLFFGDITPRTWFSKLIANAETIIGQVLTVLALGMFFTQKEKANPKSRQVKQGISAIRLRKQFRR